ncbi:hypothetical protein [Flagellimonas sp. 2504JD4-2]
MKKLTSTFAFLIVGLCLLSCNRSDIEENPSTSETMAILKVDATSIDQNSVNNFISGNHFSAVKSVADDDREL